MEKKICENRIQAHELIFNLKSRVAKDNAIRWFIINKGWYL